MHTSHPIHCLRPHSTADHSLTHSIHPIQSTPHFPSLHRTPPIPCIHYNTTFLSCPRIADSALHPRTTLIAIHTHNLLPPSTASSLHCRPTRSRHSTADRPTVHHASSLHCRPPVISTVDRPLSPLQISRYLHSDCPPLTAFIQRTGAPRGAGRPPPPLRGGRLPPPVRGYDGRHPPSSRGGRLPQRVAVPAVPAHPSPQAGHGHLQQPRDHGVGRQHGFRGGSHHGYHPVAGSKDGIRR